jgi:hypothetical protein
LSLAAGTTAVPAERRADAMDYGAEMCSESGNFTLVWNGTCMKCDRYGGQQLTMAPCNALVVVAAACGDEH